MTPGQWLESTLCLPKFRCFQWNQQEFKLYTDYSGILEQVNPLQPVGQAAEFKFKSKFEPLPVIWQSLPKAIPEDNHKF